MTSLASDELKVAMSRRSLDSANLRRIVSAAQQRIGDREPYDGYRNMWVGGHLAGHLDEDD